MSLPNSNAHSQASFNGAGSPRPRPSGTTRGLRVLQPLLLLPPLAAVIILPGFLRPRLQAALPPTLADAEPDTIQILMGGARHVLGKQLLKQVDVYYHGGVQIPDEEHHAEGALSPKNAEAHASRQPTSDPRPLCAHQAHGHHSHSQAADPKRGTSRLKSDPWHWINSHVHVQEHHHMSEDRFEELLPWIWAACRADPSNIQAYQMGAFIIWRKTNQAEGSIRLLEEGFAANPANPYLAFELGYYFHSRLSDTDSALYWLRLASELNPVDAKSSDDDRLLKLRTLSYLGNIAAARGERESIPPLWREARAISPNHSATHNLQRLMADENQ